MSEKKEKKKKENLRKKKEKNWVSNQILRFFVLVFIFVNKKFLTRNKMVVEKIFFSKFGWKCSIFVKIAICQWFFCRTLQSIKLAMKSIKLIELRDPSPFPPLSLFLLSYFLSLSPLPPSELLSDFNYFCLFFWAFNVFLRDLQLQFLIDCSFHTDHS